MSKAPGWGGGPWALVVELSVVCPCVCFGQILSQILRHVFAVACFSGDCGHWRLA